jgi:hypothetical protein
MLLALRGKGDGASSTVFSSVVVVLRQGKFDHQPVCPDNLLLPSPARMLFQLVLPRLGKPLLSSFITVSALLPTLAIAASISDFDFLKCLHQ